MNIKDLKNYYNTKPVEFVVKENFKLKEDTAYIPRFKLKDVRQIAGIPINEPIKPTQEIFVKAIKYGMIFLINYKGGSGKSEDKHFAGHERVIYSLVIGKSSSGKILIRGWHLNGWSVSSNRHMQKIWRMFRLDRVLSMTFTGSFYRLPPAGYNMNDKGMRGGIIARADFNEIRKNQQALLKAQEIQNREDVYLDEEERKFISIKVKTTETNLDLNKPLENSYINNMKDIANVRVSFLKSIYGNRYIAIIGALGKPGNTVKVNDDKGNNLGVFKVMDSIAGDTLKRIKRVKGNAVEGMWLMLQQDNPDDYILSTNRKISVRRFVELAYQEIGIIIKWVGQGIDEMGINSITGDILVKIDKEYFRPTEVDLLIGDYSKAKEKLGWEPKYRVEELINEMVAEDIKLFEKDKYLKNGGYEIITHHE